MIDSFREKCENHGVSPVVGVILLVAIVVILAAVVGILALGFGDNLTETSAAAVTIENGEARIIDMGTSEKIIVKNNESIKSNLTNAGETIQVQPGDTIIGISEDGSKNVIQSITKENVGSYSDLSVSISVTNNTNLQEGDNSTLTSFSITNTGNSKISLTNVYMKDINKQLQSYSTPELNSSEKYEPGFPPPPLTYNITSVSTTTADISVIGLGGGYSLDLDSSNNTIVRLVAEGEDKNGNSIRASDKIALEFKP